MKADSMNDVFHALAHAGRRGMLDIVRAKPGCTVQEVCREFDVSRIAVMKHLNILEAANLLISRKSGRRRLLFFNVVPIQMIHDRWTSEYSALWASGMTQLKYRLEQGN